MDNAQTRLQKLAEQTQTRVSPRVALLDEAHTIITKDRNSVYGNPEDNFKDIAELWTAYKGVQFTSMDVVVMNILIKIARLKKTPEYHDGLVDIAGYAGCGAEIQAGMKPKNTEQTLVNPLTQKRITDNFDRSFPE